MLMLVWAIVIGLVVMERWLKLPLG